MTQPLSGESSVLVTDLISDGFFLISTKGKLPVEQGKSCKKLKHAAQNRRHPPPATGGGSITSMSRESTEGDQMRASRLVVRRRMVFCDRSWLARMKRTVRLFARIKIEWVMAVAPWDRTPRKSALSLMPVAQKTMFFPLARSSAE